MGRPDGQRRDRRRGPAPSEVRERSGARMRINLGRRHQPRIPRCRPPRTGAARTVSPCARRRRTTAPLRCPRGGATHRRRCPEPPGLRATPLDLGANSSLAQFGEHAVALDHGFRARGRARPARPGRRSSIVRRRRSRGGIEGRAHPACAEQAPELEVGRGTVVPARRRAGPRPQPRRPGAASALRIPASNRVDHRLRGVDAARQRGPGPQGRRRRGSSRPPPRAY